MTVYRKAFFAYLNGTITKEEFDRYHDLKKKLMGNDAFVEADFSNPEWVEFNRIGCKIATIYK